MVDKELKGETQNVEKVIDNMFKCPCSATVNDIGTNMNTENSNVCRKYYYFAKSLHAASNTE